MQGLVNFATDVGNGLGVLLPAFCYLGALALFLFAGWGFWRQAQPDNPFRGQPWIPIVSLVLCGVLASFDRILTMANVSAGTNLQVSLVAGALSYAPTVPSGGVLGTTPGDTVINVVELFQAFFQAFGAMAACFAVMAWRSVINGRSNRSQSGCGVQFAFGIMLINVLTISQWLVSLFRT